MEWWRWVAAVAEALLLGILLLLWYDTLRERPGWSWQQAARRPLIGAVSIPIGFLACLFLPWWLVLIILAIPACAVIAMALAS